MIRPIRVAPLSNVQVSQQPIVPNNMTNEGYLANQFASGNFAQPTAMAVSRPLPQSPVQAPTPTAASQQLSQIGQQGMQGAQERVSKRITQSPRVQGLLGGDQGAGGLLSDINNQAGLQGLFATMQAIGRPVARGEDRLLGAVEYGRGVQQQAREQGVQDLSTRMRLEEMQRARQKEAREAQQRELLNAYIMGAPVQGRAEPSQPLPEGTTGVLLPNVQEVVEENTRSPLDDALSQRYDAYEVGQLTESEKQDAVRAMRLERAAEIATDAELAEDYRNRANAINERIGAKFLPREKRASISYDRRDQWDKTEYRPRVEQVAKARQLVELAQNPSGITDISLIFGLMKSLDPRSTVREGEADMVESAQGAFTRLMNTQQRLQEGRLLPDEAYPVIVESALIIANAVERDYQAAVDNRLEGLEQTEGLDADIVIPYRTLNAPDVESTLSNLRQVLNLEPDQNGGGAASAVRKARVSGRSEAAR